MSYLPAIKDGKILSLKEREKVISDRKSKKLAREVGKRNWREWYETTRFIRSLKGD
jgi:hypothetical protein